MCQANLSISDQETNRDHVRQSRTITRPWASQQPQNDAHPFSTDEDNNENNDNESGQKINRDQQILSTEVCRMRCISWSKSARLATTLEIMEPPMAQYLRTMIACFMSQMNSDCYGSPGISPERGFCDTGHSSRAPDVPTAMPPVDNPLLV